MHNGNIKRAREGRQGGRQAGMHMKLEIPTDFAYQSEHCTSIFAFNTIAR